jgi:hypothetical protein
MKRELDEDGYLAMEAFSDDDLAADEAAAGATIFADPPRLSDGDWLMAVAAAVKAPIESAGVDDEVGDTGTTEDPSSPFPPTDAADLDGAGWSDTGTDDWSDSDSHVEPTLRDDVDSAGT